MKSKLTRWFSGSAKPVHVGVYETKPDESITFQHWDGKQWGLCAINPHYAVNGAGIPSQHQTSRWRGLADSIGAHERKAP